MGLNVVAKIGKEENFSFAIPKERMFQDLSKKKLVCMTDGLCFVKDEIQELNIIFLRVMILFGKAIKLHLVK